MAAKRSSFADHSTGMADFKVGLAINALADKIGTILHTALPSLSMTVATLHLNGFRESKRSGTAGMRKRSANLNAALLAVAGRLEQLLNRQLPTGVSLGLLFRQRRLRAFAFPGRANSRAQRLQPLVFLHPACPCFSG